MYLPSLAVVAYEISSLKQLTTQPPDSNGCGEGNMPSTRAKEGGAAWAKTIFQCPGATADVERLLICMTLAVARDPGTYYGLPLTVRTGATKLRNPPVKSVSKTTRFLVPQLSLLGFPLCELGRTTLSFSWALYGFYFSIARLSGDVLSFCTSVCSAWYNSTTTPGEEGRRRSQGSLSITGIQIKNSSVFTGIEICNPGQQ